MCSAYIHEHGWSGTSYAMFTMSARSKKNASCDPECECTRCKEKLAANQSIMSDVYYKVKNAIFTEVLRRRNNAYVAHSIVKAIVSIIPLTFMNRFMEEVVEKGVLVRAKLGDKEGPRVLAKNFENAKSGFFITFGSVSNLDRFEELDAIIRKDEVAFGLLLKTIWQKR